MIYKDSVYGSVPMEEKVLTDLMQTKAMQRLKGVNQGGPLTLLKIDHIFASYRTTRFDHSVGVCLLLKKFNASLEEQIAGLLHDISHTVFSHALDFLFNRNTEHDYHEKFHEETILNSDIPFVLKKHSIEVDNIFNIEKFTLLEKELPDLCADRIDYFLRDMTMYDDIIKKRCNEILDTLTIFDMEFIFKEKEMANLFAEKFIEANRRFYCNPFQATIFKLTSDALGLAIQKNIIKEPDLFTTDLEVINKLKGSRDKEILHMLNAISYLDVVEDEKDYDYHLKSKVRCTNPKVLTGNKIMRLSEINEGYKNSMNDFITNASKGFFVRIIRKS